MAEKEYIEREALLGIFNAKADMATGTPKECFFAAAKMVGLLPAADVVEVRHGEWVEHDRYICNSDDKPVAKIGTIFICSQCGRTENRREPYCHCGAKMDGKGDG